MAHRVATAVLLLAGLVLFPIRPLVGFIVLAAGLAVLLDARGVFGRGIYRSMIGFITGLWLTVAGVVATLLGMFALPGTCDATTTACDDPDSNFLLLPGVVLLALGLTLLAWSIVDARRTRRRSSRPSS